MKEANHGLYGLNRTYAKPLWIVFMMAGIVLLAACVNLAGLLLSQAERRRHETAVRLALGASRGQILRLFLVESLLLSVFGALLGALFAGWASSLIASFVPAGGFPRVVPVEIGSGFTLRTFLFLAGMCFVTALLFGLTPAARAARQEVSPALKSEPSVTALGRRWSLRNLLLAGQVALSLFLVLGAATLIGSLGKLLTENPGYLTDKLLMVSVDPLNGRYRPEQAHQFFDQLLPRVAGLPAVQSVSLARYNPLGPTFAVGAMRITVEGYTSKAEENYPEAWPVRNVVAPAYFQTLGIPLLRGRDFTARDGPNAPKIAIINERFAQHYFGGGNPLGRRIGWNGHADIEVVGVVGNSKYADLHESAKPYWYIPYAQLGPDRWQQMTIQARIAGDAGTVAAVIRKEIADLDPSLPVFQISTIETEINYHLSRERLVAALGGFFGIMAALLAAVGIYGVASHTVTRRTKEIGIRLALGAGRGQIVRTVISRVAFMVGLGIAIGLAFSWTWRALLASFVYGVAPTDSWVAILAIGIVAGVALAAACGPVRRAAKVDPMITLRYE
ncbi:MAG: FtsX-like permease family protein [Bryobacterales bacterium]|nr:FtsX-like permease family protein [Bryobacterales bacterium]